jgi:hypothetical protein
VEEMKKMIMAIRRMIIAKSKYSIESRRMMLSLLFPILDDGSLLMVENYRHGVGANLELPGGFIDKNEDPSRRGQQKGNYLKRLDICVTSSNI